MTARSGTPSAKGDRRGTQRHIPVLLPEVLDALAPLGDGTFIDGTFGAGGYTSAILYAAPTARVLAIDRDPRAVAAGQGLVGETGGRLTLVEGTFGELERIATEAGFAPDGVVLDIGVSSMQLDDPERGFSFQGDGPLDMRMGQDGPTAADIVNREDDSDLADIFFYLGDERRSRAVARAIVARRSEKPFTRTSELAELAEKVLGRPKIAGRHAATRIFQALRIFINDGRLAVVTFHSLEDGIVKRFLRRRADAERQGSRHLPPGESPKFAPSFRIANQRPITAQEDELAANPRARSAKLRIATRTQAQAWPAEDTDPPIPRL
jgi:16S rRNA (cytosine1402-N4)-methyltransferase